MSGDEDEITPESLGRLKDFARRVIAAPKGKVDARAKAEHRSRKKRPKRRRKKRRA